MARWNGCCSRFALSVLVATFTAQASWAQTAEQSYVPVPYQEGRDVVWVPTEPTLIDKMLEMARLTPTDVVLDLGSGDGRSVIAAAKRGARAHGVEFNPDLVELAKRNAIAAGLADRATFSEGDMFEADLSQATVMPLFLIDENLVRLAPRFMTMKPGARVVSNTFQIEGWEADEVGTAERDCPRYCTAYLYIIPARVAGRWQVGGGELVLEQKFQMLTGTLTREGRSLPVENARLKGEAIAFSAGGVPYTGRVTADAMAGTTARGEAWSARRLP